MSEAIDDNIELTFPGMAAAFERTLAKDTKEDCGWLAMTDTWEASEATAAGSVLIEDAVRSDAIAAVLELAPVTPLKAWETWNSETILPGCCWLPRGLRGYSIAEMLRWKYDHQQQLRWTVIRMW
jgi:hypothetical protein